MNRAPVESALGPGADVVEFRSTAPESGLSWLGLVGFALILALLATVVVHSRQLTLLSNTLQSSKESQTLVITEAEIQTLRLREQWRAAIDGRTPLALADLQSQFELWSQRITALGAASPAPAEPAIEALRSFLSAAKPLLDAGQTLQTDRAGLAALLPQLEALDQPLSNLAQSAAQHQAIQLELRSRVVRSQYRLGLALTVVLSVLTLAFAAIALRQLRELRSRRLALEDLAASLRQARRDAEAASQAKSAFLANMSHEIRTPFHGLMGMLSLLREAGLTPKQIDYLHTATESADHLLALLNDILDMSQLESGRMSLAPAPVELRALLREAEALMRPQASAKLLALHIDAEPAVPERVLLDATRVKQVVFNLLSNAIKFSDRGAVVLDLRCRDNPAARDSKVVLEFVVTDSGIGMDEATQARLFSRFMQGDTSKSRRHGGTGLGLEISRNLARLMGGDIHVRSKQGEGSCFTFQMPVALIHEPVSAGPGRPPPGLGPARSLQVLVAEDHPVNRQYIAALLENQGHVAFFTTNGEEAVQAARERRFDLVLMDIHMPTLDGIDATRAMRALPDPAHSTVPIVGLTADAFAETRDRCIVAGMNDFLTKPLSPPTLASCLRRLFGSGAAAASGVDDGATPSTVPGLIDPSAIAMSLKAMPGHKLGALIESYLDAGPETVARLRAAVRGAQPLELRVHAHDAKGAALNLGLSGLAATAQALQEGATHLPAHEIARLVQRFENQLATTRAAIQSLSLTDEPLKR